MSKDQDLKNQNDELDDLKDQILEKDEIIRKNEQHIDECQDQLLRMQADLENYRKHTDRLQRIFWSFSPAHKKDIQCW